MYSDKPDHRSPEFLAVAQVVVQQLQTRFDRLEESVSKLHTSLSDRMNSVEKSSRDDYLALDRRVDLLEKETSAEIVRLNTKLLVMERISGVLFVALIGALVAMVVPNWFRHPSPVKPAIVAFSAIA